MPKKITERLVSQNENSWPGNQSGGSVVITPSSDCSAPQNSEFSALPEASVDAEGSVLLFSKDQSLAVRLQRILAMRSLQVRRYSAAASLLAVPPANGVACVVLDLSFGSGDELQLLEQLKATGCRLPIVILATQLDISLAVRAMRAGAADILALPIGADEFLLAIDGALAQSREVLQRHARSDELLPQFALLTSREREVVSLILAGLLNKQIAEQLHVALVTVKLHRGNAMRKLGARSAAELARLALATNFSGLNYLPNRGFDFGGSQSVLMTAD